jgi:pimeloyl-ACP methyl ester carboxylesterase
LFPRFARRGGDELTQGSRLEIFEGAGHFLHAEEPARFAALLTDFIDTTAPARRDLDSYREMLLARAG